MFGRIDQRKYRMDRRNQQRNNLIIQKEDQSNEKINNDEQLATKYQSQAISKH